MRVPSEKFGLECALANSSVGDIPNPVFFVAIAADFHHRRVRLVGIGCCSPAAARAPMPSKQETVLTEIRDVRKQERK
jgi:hypothetical protein